MGRFNRDDNNSSDGGFKRSFGGGNRSFGGGSRFGGRDGGQGGMRPAMHKTVCNECGASCEVPFKPTGERPVFCSMCFQKQGNGGKPSRFGGNDRHERPSFGSSMGSGRGDDRQMNDATCAKCGKTCQVPFRPTPGKPVYCDDCYKLGGTKDSSEILELLKSLNFKVDKLMKVIAPNEKIEKSEKAVVVENKKITVPEKVKEVVKEKKVKKVATKKVSTKLKTGKK